MIPYASHRSFIPGHYSWNTRELLTHRLEGLVFPSVLLSERTLRLIVRLDPRIYANIVLHFLGNGLTCGEVIRPIRAGQALLRHWSLGAYTWRHTDLTEGWSGKDAGTQSRILFDLMKPSDAYYLDCALHDADGYRADRSIWYRNDTFESHYLLERACQDDIARHLEEDRNRYYAHKEGRERTLMSACDVNVHVNVIAI